MMRQIMIAEKLAAVLTKEETVCASLLSISSPEVALGE
jgi:hypothetical protein